ncbi:MAG: hypothetical protein NTX61_13955 [Bacteroidetes bacterium]|nr:hypothetical protein [Bacteroidota bacterium]
MKKAMLICLLMLMVIFIAIAQHLKKDGTPDRRYKENRSLPPTTKTMTTTKSTDVKTVDTTTGRHLKKDGTPDRRYKENKDLPSNSQTKTEEFSNAPTNQVDTSTNVYCDVMTSTKAENDLSNSYLVNVFIDFGNGRIYTPDHPLKDDKTGLNMFFHSAADILNYLSQDHWTLISTHEIMTKENSKVEIWVTHFILKKKKY